MVKKNIAQTRLKNLRDSLVPEREKSITSSRSIPETNTLSNQNVTLTASTSREKKRKSDGTSENYIPKRYKVGDSEPVYTSRSELRNETRSGVKHSSQQVHCEDNKTFKSETSRLPVLNTPHPFMKSPISGNEKKNNAHQRLMNLKNNIRSNTGSNSCKNETNLSPSTSRLPSIQSVEGNLWDERIKSGSRNIEQDAIGYTSTERWQLNKRNSLNSCTPCAERQSSSYPRVKSVSPTQLANSNTLLNVWRYSESQQMLTQTQTTLNKSLPEKPHRMFLTSDSLQTNPLSILGSKSNLSPNNNSWKSNTSMSQRLSRYKDNGNLFSQEATNSIHDLENDAIIHHQLNVSEPVSEDVHMQECDSETVIHCTEDQATDAPNLPPVPSKNQDNDIKSEDICIVVDTNIFMAHLKIVKDIVNMPVSGSVKPLLYVPWMVLTELDFMKDGSTPGKSAQKAIVYINSLLNAENCRIKCQTVFEINEQMYIGKSPDDKIISCCLQISKQFKTVILLSNDVNARNKALIHGIGTCSFNEIMMKLHGLLQKNKKFQKILHKMNVVCSYAICKCANDAYGDVWTKMDLLKDRPWSLTDCLKIFKKYWISVFGDKLLKQFQVAVTDLLSLLENKSSLADDTDDFKNFTAVCGAICFFLKDVQSLQTMMEKTIKEIKDIKNA